MSENNYGALMLKSALDTSVDITKIIAPGIYPVTQGNASAPDSVAGSLTVAPVPLGSKVTFERQDSSVVYSLINGKWEKPTAMDVGAARAFSGSISIGGGGNWTTADFIVWLESQGAFNHPYWMCKGSWSYGDNRTITDTGCGNIQLAGAVVEVMGYRGAMTIRVTTPTSSTSGVVNAQFTYVNHGEGYPATWRRDFNTANKPTSEDVGALPKTGGEISGDLDVKGIASTKALYTHKLFTQRSEVPFEFGLANQVSGNHYWDIHTTYPEIDYDYRIAFNHAVNRIDLLHKTGYAGLNVGGFAARSIQIENAGRGEGSSLINHYDSSGKLVMNYGCYMDGFSINFYDVTGAWQSNPLFVGRNGNASVSGNLSGGRVYEGGIRVYSPNNPQPIDFSPYATMSWVLQNFVQNIDLTAPAEVGFRDGWGYPRGTDGAAMYNFNMVGGSSNVGNFIIRYMRKQVNGTWYIIN